MRLPTVAQVIESNLHRLDDVMVNLNHESRYGAKISKLNSDIKKCSCEVNGQDYDGDVAQFHNPFPDRKAFYQSQGSLLDLHEQGVPLIWRTPSNSIHLELIL